MALRFIKKDGRTIPIGATASKGARAGLAVAAAASVASVPGNVKRGSNKIKRNAAQPIKINRALDLTGLGLSVASGALAAATFAGGAKSFIGGAVATHAIDAVGIGTNLASVAKGGGTKGQKVKQAARQEGRNLIVGNAVYAAGLIGIKRNREVAVGAAKKIIALGRKVLGGG